jgi:hypothetical protein
VLKYIYNIDINNLPLTNSNDFDQKRKLKKKMLYNASSASSASASTATSITPTASSAVQQSPLFPVRSTSHGLNHNQPLLPPVGFNSNQSLLDRYKPRSKTEIYSSVSAAPPPPMLQMTTVIPSKQLITTSAATGSTIQANQLKSNPSSGTLASLIKNSMNLSQNNVASLAANSGSAQQQQLQLTSSSSNMGGGAQQPILTRQRKFF